MSCQIAISDWKTISGQKVISGRKRHIWPIRHFWPKSHFWLKILASSHATTSYMGNLECCPHKLSIPRSLLDLPILVKCRDTRIQNFWASPQINALILKISLIKAIALKSFLNDYCSNFKFMNLLGLPFQAYLYRRPWMFTFKFEITSVLTIKLNKYEKGEKNTKKN